MSTFNLLDMAKSYFNNEIVNKVSTHFGESESGISKAISAILPSVIGGISDKASSSTEAAESVAAMATEQHKKGILSSLTDFLHPETGHGLLGQSSGIISNIFGKDGNSNTLTTLISNFAGIKGSSVGALISMAAPTLLGLLGRHTQENNISASGLTSLLKEQKASAMSILPAGFSLGSAGAAASATASTISNTASNAYNTVEEKATGGMKWLLPLLLLAALAVGAYYLFSKGCNKKEETTTIAGTDTGMIKKNMDTIKVADMPKITMDSLTGVVNYELGALADLKLPNGTILKSVAANGFENNLVNFLNTGTIDTVNKKLNWFTIHDVQFKSGGTEYASVKAATQAKNIAEILKAYPKAILKIGGYTDASGDAAKNKALSQQRADKLMKDIIANGATVAQIKEAIGYGSEFAEAKAGDKEGMARDRRTAAKVSSK